MASESPDSAQIVPNVAAPGFDAEAMRAKYREEREKRLRADGNAQYVEVKGAFSHYLNDPTSTPASSGSRSRTRSRWW